MPEPTPASVVLDDPEDRKLVTLARSTRARTGSSEGAAVRDLDGRTSAGARVDLPSLPLSAVGVCVAMAVASGSRGLEAVVVLADELTPADRTLVADFAGSGVTIHRVDATGRVGESVAT